MKVPRFTTKDLLTVADLSADEILALFSFTRRLKKNALRGVHRNYMKNKSLAMIFEKSSTRTRVSFETGMTQLGGHALFLSSADIQLGRGETVEDTARVLSRYVDGIMIRTFEHEKVVCLASHAAVPVINGLSDTYHPCQALTDYFTIYERDRNLQRIKMAYIGDGNNMANSLILAASVLGSTLSVAAPKKYQPDPAIMEQARSISAATGARIEVTDDIDAAVAGANYLYTDVWTSMGQEKESARRRKSFAGYSITMKLLRQASPGCLVMHCLPAHRGEEIDNDVIESEHSIVFDQAENRMHVQKAIICVLLQGRKTGS
jgi:ornithine carbamoyltransferase